MQQFNRLVGVVVLVLGACGSVESDGEGDIDGDGLVVIDGGPDGGVDASSDAGPDAGPDADLFDCEPETFLECSAAGDARFCNAAGDGFVDQACGAPGCNAEAGRCNQCSPGNKSCSGKTLSTCGTDGLPAADVTCQASCSETGGAHCTVLDAKYLAGVCDTASSGSYSVSTNTTLDTNNSNNCTGGVIAQTAGPELCVVRYGAINVGSGATLTFTGGRAVALVADTSLTVGGKVDVSATGVNGGPGFAAADSGPTGCDTAYGGAGFGSIGGRGGSFDADASGCVGGSIVDPLTILPFRGGFSSGGFPDARSGGGGGAVTLVACRGTVSISGAVDAGGGGALGGYGFFIARGGGSGGYVVIQGLGVNLTGAALFANGGGGGGGGGLDVSEKGNDGKDATASTTAAPGGTGVAGGGAAGAGATGSAIAGSGKKGGSNPFRLPGGGGGGVGAIQIYLPQGVSPAGTPTAASPALRPVLTAPVK